MGKGYTVSVGGKKFHIPMPKFLGGGEKKSDAEVSIGHAVQAKTQRKNQLDEINRQLEEVGKSDMEKAVFED